ncbi:hypothetical protein BZA70DRAFT_188143 [Myxozyma melibiosi]|uniref:Uncharacterized protein n=1 Tax=Myxozyma melibiosi TaxID=54550 RepID=A0ABR1F336_9ASCO
MRFLFTSGLRSGLARQIDLPLMSRLSPRIIGTHQTISRSGTFITPTPATHIYGASYSSARSTTDLPRYFMHPESPPEPFEGTDSKMSDLPRYFSDPSNPPEPYSRSKSASPSASGALSGSSSYSSELMSSSSSAPSMSTRQSSLSSAPSNSGSDSNNIYNLLLQERKKTLLITVLVFLAIYIGTIAFFWTKMNSLQIQAGRIIKKEREGQQLKIKEKLAALEKQKAILVDERNRALSWRNRDAMILSIHIAMLRKQLVEQAGIEPASADEALEQFQKSAKTSHNWKSSAGSVTGYVFEDNGKETQSGIWGDLMKLTTTVYLGI